MRAGLRNSQFGSVSLSTLLFHVIFLERGLKGIHRAGSSESESAFGGELTSCESTPSVSKPTLLGKGGGGKCVGEGFARPHVFASELSK